MCVACRYINLLDLSDLFWLQLSQSTPSCTDIVTLWDTWSPDPKVDTDLLLYTISFRLCLYGLEGVVPYLFRLIFYIFLIRSRRNVDGKTSKNLCDLW